MDDIIQQQDEHQETKLNKRKESTETERRLQEAGKQITTAAEQRACTVAAGEDGDYGRNVSPSITPRLANKCDKRRWDAVDCERDKKE